jgi:SMC interacting uncharacterized protein involved in chromosome segregation
VHKVYLNSTTRENIRSNTELGISPEEQKEAQKHPKEASIRGRKYTQKLIQEIDNYMVNSGKIHKLTDNFFPNPTPPSS